jgi:hypothetical protein
VVELIFLGLLVGWWIFCIMNAAEAESSAGLLLFCAVIAAVVRLGIYCNGLGPPFSLRGRIATGRIIVPGFDQVFLTPVVVIALAVAGGAIIRHSGAWHQVATACVVALISFALLNGGPKLQTWLLTGQHRRHPPGHLGTNKQLLRPI